MTFNNVHDIAFPAGEYRILDLTKDHICTVPMHIYQTWCTKPYPRHRKGCPNHTHCQYHVKKHKTAAECFNLDSPMWLIYVEFDLDAQAIKMKKKHPNWSDVQCRNLLYWQRGIDNKLSTICHDFIIINKLEYYVTMGEGFGINMYATCAKLGLKLDSMRDMHTVRKMALIMESKFTTITNRIRIV